MWPCCKQIQEIWCTIYHNWTSCQYADFISLGSEQIIIKLACDSIVNQVNKLRDPCPWQNWWFFGETANGLQPPLPRPFLGGNIFSRNPWSKFASEFLHNSSILLGTGLPNCFQRTERTCVLISETSLFISSEFILKIDYGSVQMESTCDHHAMRAFQSVLCQGHVIVITILDSLLLSFLSSKWHLPFEPPPYTQ